jgi:hypothetical protein
MDTFKIIVIIFLMILTYQIYQLNCTVYKDNFEGFEGAQQSVGGVDDTNAINTLAQIAKNLMAGGVTVPGNMNVAGPATVPVLNLGGKFRLSGVGDAHGNDDWIRLFGVDNKGYHGGIAMNKCHIQTADFHVAGRHILGELDAIKNHLGRLDGENQGRKNEINWLNNNTVRMDRQYYIDIGVRANGDGCCGNGSGLIIHHAGPNGPAHAWSDKNVTTKFNFRQA